MKYRLIILAALVGLSVTPAFSAKKARRSDGMVGIRYLDSHFHLYDSLQKQIFNLAETAYDEYRSADQWMTFLTSQGFTVERGVAGIPTAFVATYGSGSPVIGMMAEYDAIARMSQDTVPYPKVLVPGAAGHACGHNLLGTGSVAGAVAVSKWLASTGASGTVKLFGCPAEEGGGGKAYMMREGVFEGLDAMLDWHPDTRNTVNRTSGLANVQVQFTFTGKSSHASGAPEAGRSALDAVEAFDYLMNLMREHVPQTSRIHYVITDGGKAPNVVPDKASVKYFFRSPSREVVQDILSRALKAAEGAAMGTGTTMDYDLVSGNYERLPNDAMADLVGRSLGKVGGIRLDDREMAFARAMVAESGVDAGLIDKLSIVVPPSEEGYEAYVSSDVGNVTWAVPTGSFRYACFVPGGVGHSWQQVASGGTTIGTKGALGAAKVLYYSAVELMTDAKLLQAVRSEFLDRRGEDFVFKPMMGSRRPPFLPAATLDPVLPAIEGVRKPVSASVASPVARPRADTTGLDVFLRSAGIQDQAESGRCWYFATANVLRGNLEFSVVYPYFWDMMEKANLFLVNVWNHRKEAVDSRYNETLFRRPTWDGGHWMNAVYLIEKYGIVPSEAMPETEVSLNTGPLLQELRRQLRAYGLKMRETTDPEAVRAAALEEISRILVRALGNPPEEFVFEGQRYTPASFRDAFVASGLSERYVMLMNDPRRPYHKMYRVEGSRNAADGRDWTFLNLPCEELEALGLASLEAGDRFYFTCDTNMDALPEEGVYDSRLFPRDSLLQMGKAELFDSRDVTSTHAMAMCGVKCTPDKSGIEYWVAENSFGLGRGADGYIQMDAAWWRRFMFRMAIDRRYLSEDQLRMTGGTPETIPYWNLY
jgi:aminobenzoyl-glutamate utilization protein B